MQQIRRHNSQPSNRMITNYANSQNQDQLAQYSQSEYQQQLAQYTIVGQGSGDNSVSSSYPPLDFYLDAITRLEDRLERYAEEIEQVHSYHTHSIRICANVLRTELC